MPPNIDMVWHKRHDNFNLASIPLVIATNFCYLGVVLYNAVEHRNLQSDENLLYVIMFWTFNVYMAIDILWLILVPRSVHSPVMIILHHIVSLLGWIAPHFDHNMRPWAAAAVTVELNTFFLIARRNFPPKFILDLGFVFTWILLRLVVYPYLAVGFYQKFSFHIHPSTCNGVNLHNTSYACLLVLIVLNIKWSVDLYHKSHNFFKNPEREKGL